MAQMIESRFRIMEFDADDVLLSDIADAGFPVHVNINREEYSEELQKKIKELEPGNIIEAEVQSESISIQDDTWRFIDIRIIEQTRFHFLDNADTHPSIVDRLSDKAQRIGKDSARIALKSDGNPIGYVTVVEGDGVNIWDGLRSGVNSHEFDLENLSNIGGPPHEVIYARSTSGKRLIFYHFANSGTELAETIVSKNTVSG